MGAIQNIPMGNIPNTWPRHRPTKQAAGEPKRPKQTRHNSNREIATVNEQEQQGPVFAPSTPDPALTAFGDEAWQTLVALRAAYQRGLDLLSEREQAHLRFLRWLIETGRIEP